MVSEQTPTGSLVDLTEALLGAGVIHPGNWTGRFDETIETCVILWSERETGQEDGLLALNWWDLVVASDVSAIDGLYDPQDDAAALRSELGMEGKPMAAFALVGSTGGSTNIGDAMLWLHKQLTALGIRADGACKQVMGALSRAADVFYGWSPAWAREQWEWSDWNEETEEGSDDDAYGVTASAWKRLPEWFFSESSSASSLAYLAKKLQPSAVEYSLIYWAIQHALELTQALDRWEKALTAEQILKCHTPHLEYSPGPSVGIGWYAGGEASALDHWYDMEGEGISQSEHSEVQMLYVFDPSDAESTAKAVLSAAYKLRIMGRFDACLTMLARLNDQAREMGKQGQERIRVRV